MDNIEQADDDLKQYANDTMCGEGTELIGVESDTEVPAISVFRMFCSYEQNPL